MPKIRRGGYVFLAWRSDHPPRHVHVYRNGRFVVKWDLDNGRPMKGTASGQLLELIEQPGRGPTMKLRSVTHNNHKKVFEVRVGTRALAFPFAKADPRPTADDPVRGVFIDKDLGREGFTYVLESGREGTVHIEQVLEYNQDPSFLRDLLLYRLTLEAQKRVEKSPLSKREIIRRLGTSATQLYRLLDQTNYRKSVDQLISLLQIVDCEVDFVVRAKTA